MNTIKTGNFIAECRKEKGLTQNNLAEKLGITNRAVSKWETGKSLPDASIMLELCEILEINVNELLKGERIITENYREIAEKNLKEMIELEIKKNKSLVKAETFITVTSLIISLIMIICGVFTAEYSPVISIILLYSGAAFVSVSLIFGILLEHDSGYYECKNCKYRHSPPKKDVIFSIHYGSDRVIKCPKCGKKDWHIKVLTK